MRGGKREKKNKKGRGAGADTHFDLAEKKNR